MPTSSALHVVEIKSNYVKGGRDGHEDRTLIIVVINTPRIHRYIHARLFSKMGKIKAHELRTKSKSDLLSQLQELKNELVMVRIECIADIHLQTVVLLILLLCVILYLHIPSLFSYLFYPLPTLARLPVSI